MQQLTMMKPVRQMYNLNNTIDIIKLLCTYINNLKPVRYVPFCASCNNWWTDRSNFLSCNWNSSKDIFLTQLHTECQFVLQYFTIPWKGEVFTSLLRSQPKISGKKHFIDKQLTRLTIDKANQWQGDWFTNYTDCCVCKFDNSPHYYNMCNFHLSQLALVCTL